MRQLNLRLSWDLEGTAYNCLPANAPAQADTQSVHAGGRSACHNGQICSRPHRAGSTCVKPARSLSLRFRSLATSISLVAHRDT